MEVQGKAGTCHSVVYLGTCPHRHQMVEGGWVYKPQRDAPDMAACPYCELALDGWENTDIPL